jgi:hypothetical protein
MVSMLVMAFPEWVSVCARFAKALGLFAQELHESPPVPLVCIPQGRAPQMSVSSETVPMAIRARAVPVPIEVWGT